MVAIPSLKQIPFHLPLIEDEEIRAVVEVLRNKWLTTGPKVKEFEAAFAREVGARHAIALNSCTAGLHLSLDAIGLAAGNEVLIPTLTFTATGEVVNYFKAKPALVDCEPHHFTIDTDRLQQMITSRTRAIIPVDFAGHPCLLDQILEIAAANNLWVIEDAAHAFPAKYLGKWIGTVSPLTAFSFYATKTLTTGEGGMVTTDNDQFAERIRMMRLHGMSRDAWKRYSAEGSWKYDVLEAGFKYNLTDMQAALGLAQLRKSHQMRERRAELARLYTEALRNSEAFRPIDVDPGVEHAWHLYVILLNRGTLRIHRDQLIEELRIRGIGTAVHFIPLHRHSFYRKSWGYDPGQFPVAEDYFQRCVSLPLYPGMEDGDVGRVVDALYEIATQYKR